MTVEAPLLRAADAIAGWLGLFQGPLSAGALIDRARRETGLTDFGGEPFEEGLTVLLDSYARESDLNLFGRFAARWDMLRFLVNLLRLREAERRDPAILSQPIVEPIFITGMPRSGTSFLHNVLAQDPDNLVPLSWETIYPCPEPVSAWSRHDRRAERVERQMAAFARLAPELSQVHPMSAFSPQECTEITAHIFRSLRLDTTHHVPSYRRWLDGVGHLAAYRFHRRFLQHLQRQKGPGRWVLKCPDHVFALEAIREIYPDARLIVLHRDPVKVLASVARLTEILRQPFTRRIDRAEIGRQVQEHWLKGAGLLVEADARRATPDPDMRHLHYRSFVSDPFKAVAALYEQLGRPLAAAAAARMRDFIASRPNGGYGSVAARLEDYGLSAPALRHAYRGYTEHFHISPEGEQPGGALERPTAALAAQAAP